MFSTFILWLDLITRTAVRPFRVLNKYYHLYFKNNIDFITESAFDSYDIPIDVLMTFAKKDFDVLPYTIKGIRDNVKHKIQNFVIISEVDPDIVDYCQKNGFRFVDENQVLPIKKSDIDYKIKGVDRSGWILQQFLKYSHELSTQEYYLTVDVDTVLIRPQSYIRGGKILVLTGDDCFPPYARMLKKLFGHTSYKALPMVCHQNFFSKSELIKLKKAIEDYTGEVWYKAILKNLDSRDNLVTFAENLTYSYWMFFNHRKDVILEYFYNKRIERSLLKDFDALKSKYIKRYKSLSFQIYLK